MTAYDILYRKIQNAEIHTQDWYDTVDLANGYQMTFSPQKDHFAGISIYLENQPDGNSGTLNIAIKDSNKNTLETLNLNYSRQYKLA